MAFPYASFISWACYGSRVHGDERGTVDRLHNRYGTPLRAGDEETREAAMDRMRASHLVLSPPMRLTVERAIRDHAAIRSWQLHALNARSTHVHTVVSAPIAPETALGQFKAWASRRLREAGLVEQGRPVWARHGSTRYLWNGIGLTEAIDYVVRLQDGAPKEERERRERAQRELQEGLRGHPG